MVEVKHITKSFEGRVVLNDISAAVSYTHLALPTIA